MNNEEKIIAKLTDHDTQLRTVIAKLTDHDGQLEKVATKLDDHDQRFERVITKLLDHDKRFENIEDQIAASRRETLTQGEEMMTILKRLDQERIFTASWIRRIEEEVEEHRTAITVIKKQLAIA